MEVVGTGHSVAHGGDNALVVREDQQTGWLSREREVRRLRRQLTIDVPCLVVERHQLRIEWMLDGAHVSPRGAGANLCALEERDPGAAFSGEGGRRAAHDPA